MMPLLITNQKTGSKQTNLRSLAMQEADHQHLRVPHFLLQEEGKMYVAIHFTGYKYLVSSVHCW